MTRTPDVVLPELQAHLADLLGLAAVDVPTDRPLGELGIDSLTAAEISVSIEDNLDVYVPLERFLGDESLADLAAEICGASDGVSDGAGDEAVA